MRIQAVGALLIGLASGVALAQSSPPPSTDEPIHWVSAGEFRALWDAPGAVHVAASTLADELAAQQELAVERRELIQAYLSSHPLAADFGAQLPSLDDDDPALDVVTDSYQVEEAGADGTSTTFLEMGPRAALASMANAVVQSTDPAAQRTLYAALYDRLARYIVTPPGAPPPQLITPASLDNADLATIQRAIRQLAGVLSSSILQLPPGVQIPLEECQDEIGASELVAGVPYGDQTGNSHGAKPAKDGIFANYDFPLKKYLTCIRSQGGRDVCHTFANTAAMETMVASMTGIKLNLSEQDLFEHDHFIWSLDLLGESGSAYGEMQHAAVNNYSFAYENQWDYNPSLSRKPTKANPYAYNCKNYPSSEPGCSDWAPQPAKYCVNLDPGVLCLPVAAVLKGATSGYQPAVVLDFMAPDDMPVTRDIAKAFLQLRTPVVYSFHMTHDMSQGTGINLGILPLDTCGKGAGGVGGCASHAVLLVGYIDNTTLSKVAANIPQDPSGGYFIVKNSWGTNHGDAGYYYMSYAYFEQQAEDAFVMIPFIPS